MRRSDRTSSLPAPPQPLLDALHFFKSWAEKPLSTAALTPSGPSLCRQMARFVEADRPGPVVELGPGTGVLTKAMLQRGIDESRLILVENNREFCGLLRERFPRATVLEGDAFALGDLLGHMADGSVATVVSGLPLFVKPVPVRRRLIDAALRLSAPGAPFVQFSYALVPAVPDARSSYRTETSSWILANLPPARVWTYRRVG